MVTARVITVSDRSYRGEREDAGGPAVKALLERAGYTVGEIVLVPDERGCMFPKRSSSAPPTRKTSR